MKKLLMITLSLLLFTMLISPVQAKRLGPLDRPLPDYNNLSLRQIFEDGQLLTNPDFDTNYSGWSANNIGIPIVENGIVSYTATAQYGRLRQFFTNNIYKGHIMYQIINMKSTVTANNHLQFYINDTVSENWIFYLTSMSGNYATLSGLKTIALNASTMSIGLYDNRPSNWTQIFIDYIYMYDLTALGIPTATKIEMDNLYSDYLKYKDMMTATDVMLIVGQLGAFVWSLVVSFEIFGFVLWEYALFGIGAGFIGYLALKIIQKKAGDDNGDSD